jgi:hypothetical protein
MKKSLLSLVLILVLGIALSACATKKSVTVIDGGNAYSKPDKIIDGGSAYGF